MPNLHARTLVITTAYTGMRFGESAGLTRAHVHLDRDLIHIAADTGALHEVSGNRWLGPPKTKAAVRDIRLPPFLIDGLDRLLHAHPYETVFCTDAGRWMWRTTFIERVSRPAYDGHPAYGWEPIITGFRVHDLRHTHRTWMDEDGIAEPLKRPTPRPPTARHPRRLRPRHRTHEPTATRCIAGSVARQRRLLVTADT
jgi:integrase